MSSRPNDIKPLQPEPRKMPGSKPAGFDPEANPDFDREVIDGGGEGFMLFLALLFLLALAVVLF